MSKHFYAINFELNVKNFKYNISSQVAKYSFLQNLYRYNVNIFVATKNFATQKIY